MFAVYYNCECYNWYSLIIAIGCKFGNVSGAGTANPPGAHEFTPGFQWCSCYTIFSFMCMFCR